MTRINNVTEHLARLPTRAAQRAMTDDRVRGLPVVGAATNSSARAAQ